MHPSTILFSTITLLATVVSAAPPRGIPAEMAKPLANIPEIYARLPVDHMAGSRKRPVKSAQQYNSSQYGAYGILKGENGKCADTEELAKCIGQCNNIFGVHSRFYNDCNDCCRKSCDPTGDCGLDQDGFY